MKTMITWDRRIFRTNRCPQCGEELMDDFGNLLDGKVDVDTHDTYDTLCCRKCGLELARIHEIEDFGKKFVDGFIDGFKGIAEELQRRGKDSSSLRSSE